MSTRPKVKICGVTSAVEGELAARLGADFVGLNFHPPSPRYVEPRRAAEIAAAVRGARRARQAVVVGVFVNRPAAEVEAISEEVGCDLLQFHGDETRGDIAPFAARAIRVLRVRERPDAAQLDGWEHVWGVLVDTLHPRLYGGSGSSWDFASLRELRGRRRVFIAGGLGPENVGAAVAAARPWGIDLCSGVEQRPGKKDPELLRRLFEELHHGASASAA